MVNGKISAKAIIAEYIEDADLQEAIDESLFIRWITDYDNMTGIAEELSHHICHLYVDGYKTEMPDNFKKAQQVVARTKKDFSYSRKEVVNSWLTHTQDPNCKIESELVCNKCALNDPDCKICRCEIPIYEVPIDRIWEIGNPQHYLSGWERSGVIGKGKGIKRDQTTEWTPLRSAMDDFYKEKYFLNDCLNFNSGACGNNSFSLEPPYINVDFEEGEIILSYLGTTLDEDGDIMVVDDAHYLEGLIHHLDYKWWNREAKRHAFSGRTNMRLFKQYANQAKQERELSISRYKARTVVPDYKEWNTFVKKVWNQRIPNRNFDENFKRGDNVELFKKYDRLLKNGDRTKRFTQIGYLKGDNG